MKDDWTPDDGAGYIPAEESGSGRTDHAPEHKPEYGTVEYVVPDNYETFITDYERDPWVSEIIETVFKTQLQIEMNAYALDGFFARHGGKRIEVQEEYIMGPDA